MSVGPTGPPYRKETDMDLGEFEKEGVAIPATVPATVPAVPAAPRKEEVPA